MTSILLPLNFTIGNGAGTCKTREDVILAAQSGIDVITVGSITLKESGNPGTNHYRNDLLTSVNALGLLNEGGGYYEELLKEMVAIAHRAGKKLAVSIAPKNKDELRKLLMLADEAGVDIVELNAGCPNIWKDGKPKQIIAYNPKDLAEYLEVFHVIFPASADKEQRLKISYTPDYVLLAELASVIAPYQITLVNMNTLANARMLLYENRKFRDAIPFGKHLGGLSGPELRYLSLGQITLLRELLPNHPIIGVLGITQGLHALEYLSMGVSGFQICGDIFYAGNYRGMNRIMEEFAELLEEYQG